MRLAGPTLSPSGKSEAFDRWVHAYWTVRPWRITSRRNSCPPWKRSPCAPWRVIGLLARSWIPSAGSRAVLIGRRDTVAKSMALLLLHRHATVTICHSRTPILPQVASSADILVAAIGRPGFVTADFVKP